MEKAPEWGTRIQAADKLANRLEGTPIQRSVDLTKPLDGMSDEELQSIVEYIQSHLAGDAGEDTGGTGAASG